MSGKTLVTSLCVLIVASSASVYGDNNILTNPGFERGREGWFDRTCAIEAAASPVHNGTGAGKAVQRLANWQGIKQSVFGIMMAGKTYGVSGWVRLDNAKSDTVAISFEQQDDGGTRYIGVARACVTDSAWVRLSGEFTLNVTGTLSVLDVYFEGPAPGVNFYVDDAIVYGPEVDAPVVIPAKSKGKAVIDTRTRHQKIEGFGASGAYYTKNLVTHQKKDELVNLLFRDLGLDIFRIRNNYEMEPESMEESIEIARAGKASLGPQGLKILISSWSPPASLKSNNSTIGGTLKKTGGKFAYDGFAQWWRGSVAAYTKAGLRIDYISIQNELDYEAPWNACRFAPAESADSTLPAFDKAFEMIWHGLNTDMGPDMPKLLAPESSGLGNSKDYIEAMDDLSHVYGYAHHLYDCSGCGSAPDRFIPRMTAYNQLAAKHGHKPVFQTEYEDEPGTWADAIHTALVMHNALTVEGVAAYLYWDLFWAPGTALVSMDDASSYTIKPTYYAFKHYSAFIDAGWQRVEASTDNTGIRVSAYISPDNGKLTAVIINTTESTDISLKLAVKNFPVSRGDVYRSSRAENCVRAGGFSKNTALKIPANSVTTLSLSARGK
jgi:glucuronoarabinoxylan endo-1,4-beta-xylanase